MSFSIHVGIRHVRKLDALVPVPVEQEDHRAVGEVADRRRLDGDPVVIPNRRPAATSTR